MWLVQWTSTKLTLFADDQVCDQRRWVSVFPPEHPVKYKHQRLISWMMSDDIFLKPPTRQTLVSLLLSGECRLTRGAAGGWGGTTSMTWPWTPKTHWCKVKQHENQQQRQWSGWGTSSPPESKDVASREPLRGSLKGHSFEVDAFRRARPRPVCPPTSCFSHEQECFSPLGQLLAGSSASCDTVSGSRC